VSFVTRDFIVLLSAHVLFFLNFSELILLPVYFAHAGHAPSRIGILMGAFNVMVVVSLPVCGLLSDRVSRKRMFASGAFLMALPSALYGVFPDLAAWHLALRAIQGVGFSCAFGIVGAMAADLDGSPDPVAPLAALTVAGIVTHAVGPLLGEYLVGLWGYEALFVSSFSFGLGSLVLSAALSGRKTRPGRGSVALRDISGRACASGVLGMTFGSVIVFVPPYLAYVAGVKPGLFFVAFVAGSLLAWGALFRKQVRHDARPPWVAASFLLSLLPVCLGWTGSPAGVLLLGALFGAGYGYLYPSLNASTIVAGKGRPGQANAIFVWAFNVGMFVSTMASGYLVDMIGYAAAFRVVGTGGLVLLLAGTPGLLPRCPGSRGNNCTITR